MKVYIEKFKVLWRVVKNYYLDCFCTDLLNCFRGEGGLGHALPEKFSIFRSQIVHFLFPDTVKTSTFFVDSNCLIVFNTVKLQNMQPWNKFLVPKHPF